MKAAVCRTFGAPLVIEDLQLAAPGPGEVQVRLKACAICRSDVTYMDGGWGGETPVVFGHEAAGIVERTGPGVGHLATGESVIVTLLRTCGQCYYCVQGHGSLCETSFHLDQQTPLADAAGQAVGQGLRTGAFAEQVVVEASQVVAIPASLPMASASLLSCGVITGFGAVTNVARIQPGMTTVTIGTGGVGLNCIQGAAISRAARNIAVDLSDDKIEAARRFGASHGLNAREPNLIDEVRRLSDGRGADCVFVAAGSAAALEQALQLVRRGGMVVLVGMTAEGVTAQVDTLSLAGDAVQVVGSKMGRTDLATDIPQLVAHYQAGRLKLDELVSGHFVLEEINDAVDGVRRGKALRNVIVFPDR
ncbi:MAG: alcohol dehydrogenase catalytic domain-containing protein [Arenicellales bacterium]|nr:alcohol dehydrogenase catalytic domain-containing protein [Arenicellales bacterium]